MTMNLSTTFLVALTLLVAGAAQGDAAQPEANSNRYNVLFIAVDDLRPELGCFGADYAQTPHLDRFAGNSLRFLRHYVCVATCGASRYAMLTGRSPKNTGVTAGNNAFYTPPTALSETELAGAQSLPRAISKKWLPYLPVGQAVAYSRWAGVRL